MSLAHRRGPLGEQPHGALPVAEGGWVYVEPSPKRVRVIVASVTVADSTRARLLHQPGASASWWVPRADVREDLLAPAEDRDHPVLGRLASLDLRVGGHIRRGFAHTLSAIDALGGLIQLDTFQADGVYEEDEAVAAEPIDPFHRVDVRDAARHVHISVEGVVIADSHAPRMVFETTARPRFYLTSDEIRTDLLTPSPRPAVCQYKGDGEYFHLQLDDQRITDLVWRYTQPRDDGRRIAGRYAIHHERCRTELDGEVLFGGGDGGRS